MKQYIDKAVVTNKIWKLLFELRKAKKFAKWRSDITQASVVSLDDRIAMLNEIMAFLNTLEAEKIDLEKEIEIFKGDYEQVDVTWNNDFDFIAKHFYELGLKAKGV